MPHCQAQYVREAELQVRSIRGREELMRTIKFEPRTRNGFMLMLAIALIAALTQIAVAQESSAITGKISDPSGGAVVGATVPARDTDRGTPWSTKPNSEGVYNLPRL